MERKNVLIYPCGAENAIEVYRSIRYSVHINVIPATADRDHSDLIYAAPVEYLPKVDDPGFLPSLQDLVLRKGIDLIFPTHDTVAYELSVMREVLPCGLISSGPVTMRICRYKRETYDLLNDQAFCPVRFSEPATGTPYPIITKPNVGQGSVGVALVNDVSAHAALVAGREDLLFVEYLPGREFTVDCFTDRHGKLLFVGPRERSVVKMGMAFEARSVAERSEFIRIAEVLNERMTFRGLWFFQVKEDADGRLKLLEVCARVASTMGYFRHKGVNLPLLSVFDAMDMDVVITEADHDVQLYRSTVNRFRYDFAYQRAYLDLDDTLIIDDHVSVDVIAWVYHCIGLGKEVHLITKHDGDVDSTLRKVRVDPALFASVIKLGMNESKADHIRPDGAIFVDNWHKERKEVHERHGIPVFDVDAVASLMVP